MPLLLDHEMLTYLYWFGIAFLTTLLGTLWIRPLIVRLAIMDVPNDRSSHNLPTPNGGGIVTSLVLAAMFYYSNGGDMMSVSFLSMIASFCFLSLVSFIDDIRELPFTYRLVAQIFAASLVLYFMDLKMFDFMNRELTIILLILCWVGYMNAYNFMDGIDGITVAETAHIGLSFLLLSLLHQELQWLQIDAIILIGVALGFGIINWHPAKIFMGDVGSIPIGFYTGYVFLRLIFSGYMVEAIIIPSYYLMDSGLTLIRRILNKERFWEAHRSHFYQQAVQQGNSHSVVVCRIMIINLIALVTIIAVEYARDYQWIICLFSLLLITLKTLRLAK